ncbi:deoxyribonuclease-2-alpha-like [Ptychodera flava]|uniref:deoxyribonuclease-2-alpha-like n=1 Tax=Ptychodera flava TaxID=63121 RepID=UPI003969C0A1
MLYSDQEPDGGSSHTAHAKGALLFDSSEGFWMVHSLPRFPADPSMKYIWPENGYINGQVFLCVTYPRQELDTIKNQILFYKPNIYSRHPQPSGLSLPSAAQSADGSTSPISLVTLKDRQFLSIAKQDGHDLDIYEYVAERLRVTGFDVQTWRNGMGEKLASCTGQTKYTFTGKYSVENIDTLQFPSPNGGTITYERTKDHSKWCVSDDRSRPWVCIGDLNRMVSQRTRGGGVVCLNNLAVWEQFRRLRGEIEVANIDRRDCPGVFSLHFVQYVFSYFSDPLRKHDVSRRSLDLPNYLRARN